MKKDLIIAVLATFCLTVTLFTVIPINSQSIGDYDPWADINDDGTIDMKEFGYYAKLYGMTGDPTKNVNITDWLPPKPRIIHAEYVIAWEDSFFNISTVYGFPPLFISYDVSNYTRVSVFFSMYSMTYGYGEAVWAVKASWSFAPYRPYNVYRETIESTSITVNGSFSGPCICESRVGSSEIKLPRLQLMPTLLNIDEAHQGRANCSITMFLTY